MGILTREPLSEKEILERVLGRTREKITITIYRSEGTWFGALWIDGELDSCDELPCDGDAPEDEAREAAATMPLTVNGPRTILRTADLP